MTHIVPLSSVPHEAAEQLLDSAFGADRKQRTAYRLREGLTPLPALSFAALDHEGGLEGLIQCWPVRLATGDGAVPLVLVGPVGVAPARQGRGIGKALMEASLAAAGRQGHPALMMIGDPEYYGRFFGFAADATAGWELPGPVERRRLLARLAPGLTLPRHGRIEPDPHFASAATSA